MQEVQLINQARKGDDALYDFGNKQNVDLGLLVTKLQFSKSRMQQN